MRLSALVLALVLGLGGVAASSAKTRTDQLTPKQKKKKALKWKPKKFKAAKGKKIHRAKYKATKTKVSAKQQ